jgi:hypothetical protein
MKRLIAFLVVVACLLVVFAPPAQAWYCQARSAGGAFGWATSYSPARAEHNALFECAIRTPSNYLCVVTWCK